MAKATQAANKKASKKVVKTATREKKDGLRKPQLRILVALSKSRSPLNRAELAKKAPVDPASCVEYVGSSDPKVRAANDKKHFPSLITLGYVKETHSEEAAGSVYEITAAGKKAAEAAK